MPWGYGHYKQILTTKIDPCVRGINVTMTVSNIVEQVTLCPLSTPIVYVLLTDQITVIGNEMVV